jgi:hypothetical protein
MEILLLTQESCAFCDEARDLLNRLSAEYDFPVVTVERGAVPFPPGIFINGQPFSYGRPSERKLRRELDRRMGIVERP